MKIQLDTKALEALFPEGSDARVELQNAVIANFAKKMQEKHLSEVTKNQIHTAVRDAGVNMDSYSIVRDMLNKTITNNGWDASKAQLKTNASLANAVRNFAQQQDLKLHKSMEVWAMDYVNEHLGKRSEAGKRFVERYVQEAEMQINKAKQQAFSEIESRIVAVCKQNMPEIIRRELSNYLNKESVL
ncbi:hypothetical protein OFDDKENP_00226 [Aeromonas phage B614]|nr:hypothetical protein OFDDKENP_00226 [Aeromonas phage B614]UYD58297.1 hypothetical protein JNEOFJEA_00218 [Aeromonas phage UP87]UYD58411.1 hypothetical protein IPAKJDPM_00068 [Aeromonas phage avDM14-QBC]UYD58627.1 hypothetical protein HNNIDBEH_00034 [Aeromonas phage avDM10-HWA]UYD59070.1 hypothetical protein OFOPOMKI_00220 [Aeromonas phage avDM7-IJDJ]UYD59882.1 hypothetical protein LEHPIFIF_00109 [Aeromonas phage avDM9-HANS]